MGILEKMRLDGKIALVTGGARGIGFSIANALAEAGATVVLADMDIDTAKLSAKKIHELTGRDTLATEVNVTDPKSVEEMMVQLLENFGKLDIAFCNAGICINVPADQMSFEEWRKVISVNLDGVFLTAVAAGKQMIKQGGGSIINTASMSAHIVNFPQPQCAYNASKAGVIQLTKSLAIEWADKNVRVNSISPGYIGTDLTLTSKALAPLIEEWKKVSPLKRLGRPDELQAISVYLASEVSSFTTGSDFIIDGAFTCI